MGVIKINNLLTIIGLMVLLGFIGIIWCICMGVPRDPLEDQDQEKYLEEWISNKKTKCAEIDCKERLEDIYTGDFYCKKRAHTINPNRTRCTIRYANGKIERERNE